MLLICLLISSILFNTYFPSISFIFMQKLHIALQESQ